MILALFVAIGDLFYRLNVVQLDMPPLRARRTDIPLLARSFLDRFSKENERPIEGFSDEALDLLDAYHWRQLKTNEGRADTLCRCEVLLGEAEAFFELPERYAAVTADEVVEVASRVFHPDRRTVATLEPVS